MECAGASINGDGTLRYLFQNSLDQIDTDYSKDLERRSMTSKIVGKEGTGTRVRKGAAAIRVRNVMDQKIVFVYSLPNSCPRTAICVDSTEYLVRTLHAHPCGAC